MITSNRSRFYGALLSTLLTLTFLASCTSSTEPAKNTPGSTDTLKGILSGPSLVDFGSAFIGESVDSMITLTNTGTDQLTIKSQVVTGKGFSIIDPSNVSIAPGAKLAIHIRYTPTDSGTSLGYDTIVSDAKVHTTILGFKGAAFPKPDRPGVGSRYIFLNTTLDSNGHVSDQWLDTLIIGPQNMSYAGRIKVTEMHDPSSGRILHVNYPTNGNIEVNYNDQLWEEIPTVTGGTRSYTISDTTYTDSQGNPVVEHEVETYTYAGTEEIPLLGKTFTATKIRYNYTSQSNGSSYSNNGNIWFVADLGYYVKVAINGQTIELIQFDPQ